MQVQNYLERIIMKFPEDIEKLKTLILDLIQPICPANEEYLYLKRTNAGDSLPPYYLVYFLFVKLLNFRNFGQSEKVAWSIPIDFNGKTFFIEYRKMGLGVFAHDPSTEEKAAEEIVSLVKKAINKAEPYFDFIAQSEVNGTGLNVINNSSFLYDRYFFLLSEYKKIVLSLETLDFFSGYQKNKQANWMALSTIDAFYSWTEHVFIHVAIITGKLHTGKDVVDFVNKEWKEKYKFVLNISDNETKVFYDTLVSIKQQLRNFYAHGAFGKTGEAFNFHSGTGAVPVQISLKNKSNKFSLNGPPGFDDAAAIQIIESFINFLWIGKLSPAKMYIQESDLPMILTYASDGTYDNAMRSDKEMEMFIEGLSRKWDNAADMDW